MKNQRINKGFTLIELVLVIVIAAGLFSLVGSRIGVFNYWKEEGFVRRLSETITFLHYQAVVDQAFYRMEFKIVSDKDSSDPPSYKVGVMRTENQVNSPSSSSLPLSDPTQGILSLELDTLLFSDPYADGTMIPPPTFPSLGEDNFLPQGMSIMDIRTMRGVYSKEEEENPYILFSPRGFSEFAVIHLKSSSGKVTTILINPFTGNTEIFHEYRDFQWTYSRSGKNAT